MCLLCLCERLFICALWSPAGKGLTSWLSFVVSNCEFVTFPLVSWVRCGTWLYRFLIFAPLPTFMCRCLLYSYFMPVCSIVKTITPRCRGRPGALLHEANQAWNNCCITQPIWWNILKPTANWSPYSFTLVQKVKHRVYKIHVFFKWSNTVPRLCKLFHLKMTCSSFTDEAREEVHSFQKVTLFIRYKPQHKLTFLFVWSCYWLAWYKKNKLQKFWFHRTRRFCYSTT